MSADWRLGSNERSGENADWLLKQKGVLVMGGLVKMVIDSCHRLPVWGKW